MIFQFAIFGKILANFWQILTKIEIAELCKGVHCVDLGESFQTHIYLQNLASIQPRTSPLKFAARAPDDRVAVEERLPAAVDWIPPAAPSRTTLRREVHPETATSTNRQRLLLLNSLSKEGKCHLSFKHAYGK